jgi:hypothetical protein
MEPIMRILLLLLTKFFLISAVIISSAYAKDYQCSKSMNVLLRVGLSHHEMVKRDLNDFLCQDGRATNFEGKYFKIVDGVSNKAILFDNDVDLVTKAANVYYHMNVARKFWTENIKSDYVKNMKQLVVRINIKNLYSQNAHFKNLEQGENSNNAWTIPAGKTPDVIPDDQKDSWGIEVWFAPLKKISVNELIHTRGENPLSTTLRALRNPVLTETAYNLGLSIIGSLIAGENITMSNFLGDLVFRSLTLHSFFSASLFFTDKMDKWFYEKYFYIETAMIPDIIYHEFSHVALSGNLPLSYGTPVIEGMADFFATRIVQTEGKMFSGINGYSNNQSKDPNNDLLFDPIMENRVFSDKDFVLSLLWRVRKNLEKANSKNLKYEAKKKLVNTDQLIYHSSRYLDGSSNINLGLSKALVKSCRNKCNNLILGVSIIQESLEEKGL